MLRAGDGQRAKGATDAAIADFSASYGPKSLPVAEAYLVRARVIPLYWQKHALGGLRQDVERVEIIEAYEAAFEILREQGTDPATQRRARHLALQAAHREMDASLHAAAALWLGRAIDVAPDLDPVVVVNCRCVRIAQLLECGDLAAAMTECEALLRTWSVPLPEPRKSVRAPDEPERLEMVVLTTAEEALRQLGYARGSGIILALLAWRVSKDAEQEAINPLLKVLIRFTALGIEDGPALDRAQRAIQLAGARGRPFLVALLESAAGNAADRLGQHAVARELYAAALERLDPVAPEAKDIALELRYRIAENARFTHELLPAIAALRELKDELGNRRDAFSLEVVKTLADALLEAGQHGEAEQLIAVARVLATELGDSARLAGVTLSLGTMALVRGDNPRAAECFEQAAESYSKVEGGELSCANAKVQLSAVTTPQRALALLREAIPVLEKHRGTGHPENAIAYLCLAKAELAVDPEKAFGHARHAFNLDLQFLAQAASKASEARLDGLAGPVRRSALVYWMLVRKQGWPEARVTEALTQFAAVKGLVGRIIASRRSWLERNRRDVRQTLRERIAAGEVTTPDALSSEVVPVDVIRGAIAPRSFPDLRAAIPAGSALVFFIHLTGMSSSFRLSAGVYLACVVTEAGSSPIVELGPTEAIDSAIDALHTALSTGAGATQLPHLLASVSDLVWSRLASKLEGRRALVVAPDGSLYRVPFGALRGPAGIPLGEQFSVSYVDGPRDLLQLGEVEPELAGPPLVLADPAYDLLPGAAEQTEELRFESLPYAAAEGNRVAQVLGAKAVTRASARFGELTCARSPEILHLATHGFVGTGHAALPELGLALAGVNDHLSGRALPADAAEGTLSAEQIACLDLRETDLVVLSACQTARGQSRGLEGVAGLVSALRRAGARSVLAALWNVDDARTASLMGAFYTSLLAKSGRAEALHEARAAVPRRFGEALSIADAFVLYGDPAPLLRFRERKPPQEAWDTVWPDGFTTRTIPSGNDSLRIASFNFGEAKRNVARAKTLLSKARSAADAGELGKAAELARQVLDDSTLGERHADAWFELGRTLLLAGDDRASLMFCGGLARSGLLQVGLETQLRFHRGSARYQAGDPRGAIPDLTWALTSGFYDQRGLARTYINRALAWRDVNESERAVADAQAVLALAEAEPEQTAKARLLLNALASERR